MRRTKDHNSRKCAWAIALKGQRSLENYGENYVPCFIPEKNIQGAVNIL